MNMVLSTAHSTALNMKDNPYQILPHLAAVKFHINPCNIPCRPSTAHSFCVQDRLYLPCSVATTLVTKYPFFQPNALLEKADVSTANSAVFIMQSIHSMFCACCVCSNEEQSKRQLFSNRAFGWKKGYFVTMNNRTSLHEQQLLYCIHPQHTHSPCTSTCTTHPAIPSQLPSTTLLCTQLTKA